MEQNFSCFSGYGILTYPVDECPERNYISNSCSIVLIDSDEFERIENKEGTDMDTFELISKDIVSVKVQDTPIPFNSNYKDYETLGIVIRGYENPGKLIAFEDFVRYLNETDPVSIDAREEDIVQSRDHQRWKEQLGRAGRGKWSLGRSPYYRTGIDEERIFIHLRQQRDGKY